jgi:hypothetical protein
MAPIAGGILLLLIAGLVFVSPSPIRRSRRRRVAGHSDIEGEVTGEAGDFVSSYTDAGSDCGGDGGGGCD